MDDNELSALAVVQRLLQNTNPVFLTATEIEGGFLFIDRYESIEEALRFKHDNEVVVGFIDGQPTVLDNDCPKCGHANNNDVWHRMDSITYRVMCRKCGHAEDIVFGQLEGLHHAS